jgi:hypothetical protein
MKATKKKPNAGGRPRSEGFSLEQHKRIAPELQATIHGLSRITKGLHRSFKQRSKAWGTANRMLRDVNALYQNLAHHQWAESSAYPYLWANVQPAHSVPFWRWASRFDERTRNRRAMPAHGLTREIHVELARELYGIESGLLQIIRGMNRAGFSVADVAKAQRASRSISELIAALDEEFQEQEGELPGTSPYCIHMAVAESAHSRAFADSMAGVLNPNPAPSPDGLSATEAT